MTLSTRTKEIEKACKEVTRAVLNGKNPTINIIPKSKAMPVLLSICPKYNLDINYMIKILDLR